MAIDHGELKPQKMKWWIKEITVYYYIMTWEDGGTSFTWEDSYIYDFGRLDGQEAPIISKVILS